MPSLLDDNHQQIKTLQKYTNVKSSFYKVTSIYKKYLGHVIHVIEEEVFSPMSTFGYYFSPFI